MAWEIHDGILGAVMIRGAASIPKPRESQSTTFSCHLSLSRSFPTRIYIAVSFCLACSMSI